MQSIEMNPRRIIDWDRSNFFAQRRPQRIHSRNDPELRDQRESKHEA